MSRTRRKCRREGYREVPDGRNYFSRHGLVAGRATRRLKRHLLRSWRHHNKDRISKGLEPERYDKEWLD